jgi:heterodisulfide reductase subunit A
MSLAMLPAAGPDPTGLGVGLGSDGFLGSISPKLAPPLPDQAGVFAAGTALGPKDIVDTIVEAGAAASQAAAYLAARRAAGRAAA